jgi:hypothetical protein
MTPDERSESVVPTADELKAIRERTECVFRDKHRLNCTACACPNHFQEYNTRAIGDVETLLAALDAANERVRELEARLAEVFCYETGSLSVNGACPIHHGDACLRTPGGLVEKCNELRERVQELEAVLRDVAASGVELDHPGMGYVVVQIDRWAWDRARELCE